MRGMVIGNGVIVQQVRLSSKTAECPRCKRLCGRHSLHHRWLRDAHPERPLILEVTTSKHFCSTCERHFIKPCDLAPSNSSFTHRVHRLAVAMVVEDGVQYRVAKERMLKNYHVLVPETTLHGWVGEGTWDPSGTKEEAKCTLPKNSGEKT
jgi:hypothetical protein